MGEFAAIYFLCGWMVSMCYTALSLWLGDRPSLMTFGFLIFLWLPVAILLIAIWIDTFIPDREE